MTRTRVVQEASLLPGPGAAPRILGYLSLSVWLALILAHGRFWQAGPVLRLQSPRPRPSPWPSVTVVVPARDEAESIGRVVRDLRRQDYPGALSIVVVDDRSTDATGAIARAAGEGPGAALTVIDGVEPPEGWSGKLWAVRQGVAAAGRPDFVLLTDADIVRAAGHVRMLVEHALDDDRALVSEMVELSVDSAAERALVPAFVFFFALLYPFARVNRPESRTAAAAGGTMLVRREVLEAIGGIDVLRGALIDDVTLAGHIKRHPASRGRIWLGHSALARSIRPYPKASDVWRMVARTAYVQLRYSPAMLAGTVAGMGLVWLVPPALALRGRGAARALGAAGWALSAASFLPTLRRFGLSPARAVLLPAVAAFYTAATIGSAVDHYSGRGVRWKNRAYKGGGRP